MKKRLIALIITLSLFSVVGLAGCDSAGDGDNVNSLKQARVIDYGNGVYYFPYTSAYFGNALSSFIEKNPNLKLICFSGNGNGLYGTDLGYFAVFRSNK